MSKANALGAQASEHVKTMGTEIGPLFHALEGQYVVARTQWEDVRTLFGHSQERIDLLFKASRLFFANWYEVFWDRALVQISALTCSATAKNITVRRLPVLVDAKIKADVRNAVNEAVLAAKFTDDPRNKWIAHRDKNLMLNPIWIGSRRHTAAIGGAR